MYSHKQLKLMDAAAISICSQRHIQSVIEELIETALAAPTPAEAPADVARDAERYRWLRDKCRATGEHWGGRWSLVIEGPCPDGEKSSGAIDKAFDVAIKRQGGE